MTPLQRVRENPEKVREMLEARGFDAPLDRILELDRKVRDLRAKKERLQAERNKASRGGPPSDEVKRRMREVGDQIKAIDAELGALEIELNEKALWIPNEIDLRGPRSSPARDSSRSVARALLSSARSSRGSSTSRFLTGSSRSRRHS